ncbi:hypothetical protein [Streptomyces sp. NPDC088554]|uniref:hypothetical protein n=1 Tax=Streptomyces sp. NPDC088554 TaxID=3365865 RepID=UPI0037F743BA
MTSCIPLAALTQEQLDSLYGQAKAAAGVRLERDRLTIALADRRRVHNEAEADVTAAVLQLVAAEAAIDRVRTLAENHRARHALLHASHVLAALDTPATSITPPIHTDLVSWAARLAEAGDDPGRLLALAELSRRRLTSALIASAHLLDVPLADAPTQTPWRRSVHPALRALTDALRALHSHPDTTPAGQHTTITPAPAGYEPPALRRAIDRALTTPVACPDCKRTIVCPCDTPRHEERIDTLLAAITPWLPQTGARRGD